MIIVHFIAFAIAIEMSWCHVCVERKLKTTLVLCLVVNCICSVCIS